MDDKNFDQQTAIEWIKIIEDPGASIREQDIYPLLRHWITLSPVKRVLDIGCGQGICSTQFSHDQIQYVGVEPSLQLLKRAQELYSSPSRLFIEGNAYHLPFKNKSFDAVFSIAVWHLLENIEQASSELARVIKDGGSFLIITADPAQYSVWTERYEDRKFEGSQFIGANRDANGRTSSDTLYLRPLHEILESLQKYNLVSVETQTIRSFIAISGRKG